VKAPISGGTIQQLRELLSKQTTLRYAIPILFAGLILALLWQVPGSGSAMQAVPPTATMFINPPPTVTAIAQGATTTEDVVDNNAVDNRVANTEATIAITATETQTGTDAVSATMGGTGLTALVPSQDSLEAISSAPLEGTVNILILGSDRRPNTSNWRTDVMMIVALDFASGRAGVISIPRDVYIAQIPKHQPNRVNVIDYLGERDEPDGGGPALLKEIIQEQMGIRIDHYLRFDFSSFQEVVDALGGVDVEVDCAYYDYFEIEDVILNIQPGLVHLSGAEALVYVRSRRLGGDLDRARRQQRFVWAVRNQVHNDGLLPRVPALYQALDDTIQTDIGILNAIRIVRFVLNLDEEHIHGFVLAPPTLLRSGWRSGMSVFIPDWAAIQAATETIFAGDSFLDTNTPTRCP